VGPSSVLGTRADTGTEKENERNCLHQIDRVVIRFMEGLVHFYDAVKVLKESLEMKNMQLTMMLLIEVIVIYLLKVTTIIGLNKQALTTLRMRTSITSKSRL